MKSFMKLFCEIFCIAAICLGVYRGIQGEYAQGCYFLILAVINERSASAWKD